MSHELYYTSAPKGLQPGSGGFCTVAATRGLPPLLVEKLESLSGYRPIFPPHDPQASRNPVVLAHYRVNVQGKNYDVMTRVCAAGLDHTQRTNKFAHHVVLEATELPSAGPAWLLRQPGFLESAWDGQVRQLPAGRTAPRGDSPPAICRTWQEWTGDAGWAGVLAETFLRDPQKPAYLLYQAGQDPLPLLAEALALIPADQRWQVTFSTYFTSLPPGLSCAWRCVPKEAPEAVQARQTPGALVLDLGRGMGAASGDGLVEGARTGKPGKFVPGTAIAAAGSRVPSSPLPGAPRPRAGLPADITPPGTPARNPLLDEPPVRSGSSLFLGALLGMLLAGAAAGAGYYLVVMPKLKQNQKDGPEQSGKDTAALDKEVADLRKQLQEQSQENTRKLKEADDRESALKTELKEIKAVGGKEIEEIQKLNLIIKDRDKVIDTIKKERDAKAIEADTNAQHIKTKELEIKKAQAEITKEKQIRKELENVPETRQLVALIDKHVKDNPKEVGTIIYTWYKVRMDDEIHMEEKYLRPARRSFESMKREYAGLTQTAEVPYLEGRLKILKSFFVEPLTKEKEKWENCYVAQRSRRILLKEITDWLGVKGKPTIANEFIKEVGG